MKDGRTGFGAPHVKPKSGRSFLSESQETAPGATKLYSLWHCLTPSAAHICV